MSHIMITGMICSAALLLAIVSALAAGADRLRRISGLILGPAAVAGLCFYCGAFLTPAEDAASAAAAVLRGVLSTCVMFVGRADYAAASGAAPWLKDSSVLQVIFWLAHLSAFFVSAAAVLSALGRKLVQTLRLYAFRAKDTYIVFGLHEQSVSLGRDIAQKSRSKFIYISPEPPAGLAEQVTAFGGIVRQEPYLPGGGLNETLLRMHGVKPGVNRGGKAGRVTLLALDAAENVNLAVAGTAVRYFKVGGINPRTVRVLMRGRGELDFSHMEPFKKDGNAPVYDVEAFSEAELSARVMINTSPPWSVMKFDAEGRAQEDFSALVLGFGQVGQHALRHLVMNGQFMGSMFSAAAVDNCMDSISGQFLRRYPGMAEYGIKYIQADTRSAAFYELLDGLAGKIKYIVVALGTDEANYEATADLERYFRRMDEAERPMFLVNVCNKKYAAQTQENIRFFDTRPILYTERLLIRNELDGMAEAVNYTYAEKYPGHGDSRTEWNGLSYFERESSRASAAFIPAMLYLAGLTEDQASDHDIFKRKVKGELLEVLARTEHLRWNAFHHAMGYEVMPRKEALARSKAGIRPIHKDTSRLRHSCLIDWEELDGLSEFIGGLQGKFVDYKAMDRDNVLEIPRTLGFAFAGARPPKSK